MPHPRQYSVYILTNRRDGVLYIGVTSDLRKRVWQHRNHKHEGFTDRYNLTQLVYDETFRLITNAIAREKQLKGWTRRKKLGLIDTQNPEWVDLAEKWF